MPMTIWIDADACPRNVLTLTKERAAQHHLLVITVSNYNHEHQGINHLTVDAASQAADMAIVMRMQKGDLVITQDYGLAALVLARKGYALSPHGKEYTDDNIDQLLAMRAVHAKARRAGKRAKIRGPAARTQDDDLHFDRLLQVILARMNNADMGNV